jgi:hypothetical protein
LRGFSEWWVFRRWWRTRRSVCARKAGTRVNWILRKQLRLRACSGRASVNARARKHALCAFIVRLSINGRAQAWRVAGKRLRESKSPIFKFKSLLKTSTISFNAVIVGFARRPAPQAEAARANYNRNVLCSKSFSSAGRMRPGKDFVLNCRSTE